VKDLDALREAAKRLGMEFVHGQSTYRWFGKHVGDFPLPEGFTAAELGTCEHALRLVDAQGGRNDDAYEVGVVKRRDGRPGYTLLWDFFAGGFGLRDKIGDNAGHLKREYAAVVAVKTAMARGFMVQELRQPDGSIQLRCTR
jgi:hypothetical protein